MNQPPTPERPEQGPLPEDKETNREDEPRIYVASLADYNAGRLHGTWIDANQEPEEIEEAITEMLSKSTEPIAEEWAIHDYEGFGPLHLSEYEAIEAVSAIGRGIAEHGRAFAHWADMLGPGLRDQLHGFENSYHGHWSSAVEFAESLLEDMGIDLESLLPDALQPYVDFDVQAFARDLAFDYYIAEGDDGVYVFEDT